jgi:Zn-dependent M16 (insulinase) family peptidase
LGPDTYSHPDLPALLVANAYLRAVEGPLWVAIRGTGLAYGVTLRRSVDLGKVHFYIDRSPDCYKAFIAGRAEIEGYASGAKPLQKLALESAVGEIVFEMADEAATMGAAADESFVAQVMHGTGKEYSKEMLIKIGQVTPDEVKAAIGKYLVPLFKPETANLVVTCSGMMEDKMLENFKGEGFKVEKKSLEDFEDGYGLEEVDGDEDEEESEEEDGSDEGSEEEDDEDEEMKD